MSSFWRGGSHSKGCQSHTHTRFSRKGLKINMSPSIPGKRKGMNRNVPIVTCRVLHLTYHYRAVDKLQTGTTIGL